MQSYLEKYINSQKNVNSDCKPFIIRQIGRMPDHFQLGVKIICFIFYVFNIPSSKMGMLDKLLSSLNTIKKYES
jgi:hypothetical protein